MCRVCTVNHYFRPIGKSIIYSRKTFPTALDVPPNSNTCTTDISGIYIFDFAIFDVFSSELLVHFLFLFLYSTRFPSNTELTLHMDERAIVKKYTSKRKFPQPSIVGGDHSTRC